MDPRLAAVDRPYDGLAALPRELWLPTLISAVGTSEARLRQGPAWLAALEAGELPDVALDFDDPQALRPLRQAIGELGLHELAREAPAAAQQVLRTALWHLDRLIDRPADEPRETAIAEMVAAFRAEWTLLHADWEHLLALLQDLGELAALQRDALRGRLARREWQAAQQLAALLTRNPALVALIASLGRGLPREAPPQPAPTAPGRKRVLGQLVETRLPDAPGEILGVRPGRNLARMLPSEAAQLRHPLLHKLWRARLAEARLMVWDEEAVLFDRRPGGATPLHAAAQAAPPPLARGPMLVCIDTSGSMRGAPEQLAKAVVLQAARTAHRERRACQLIAFGGAGELLTHELALTPAGLDALLDFIGQAFDGGTDLAAPLAHAVAAVHSARWQQADLLLVSDGEFGCTPATLALLDGARQRHGLRVQGVLVGDRETMGLLEVCDAIHWVRDWRRYAPDPQSAYADGHSPVHSKSLTALYFPNALSERARRHLQV
ncbi:VWA domain-containing protein [Methylibium petroleiphilum]|uniref:VWA domain-containing protein n=1 Tax=Methylibium petroleiphilum TaxID=105560 RepID=UPI001ACDE9DD|nr:VWA domain-containing protein [Methylibium petroleiphilum]MBN9205626.1 VWA domain-containing protein [Methylibium petroleiphilum]